MTKRDFLRNEVLNLLGEKLKNFDFKLLKSDTSYINKTEFGWNKFTITFLLRDIGWIVRCGALIRFDIVENLFHQISDFDKKYQKGTPTIGTSIEDLGNSSTTPTRFELTNEIQINGVVSGLAELFENVAVPFFERYNKLSVIDEKLNSNTKDTSLTGDIFKGTKALITAKLTKRNNFDELATIYHSYYENFADGFYLPEYLRLKELLKSYA
ncbi:MAG: hypothetical protein Q4G16_12560 [Cruoricaptor ignavus]|nr:hypothetical protein [Cruoricaptor ignavus]